ncbi:BAG family molecular chaperone regulator 1 isoform X1 [Malania oleifera]|uniref:BAG family molecular chaperone regulator 1 isoform X1 n=1 Tax=Malania oleifera TaxID=397392 RepID=UPI0025AECBD4|nr:BAG family molecular chaperone regulator 1 isoform X1 [Malania oleifera]
MMRMKTKTKTSGFNGGSANGGGDRGGPTADWELRPGGMLVQRRTPDSDHISAPVPMFRVRVKYRSVYHEINISSQATFGELKKMLTGPTGLHHQDQKLLFKDKERDSNAFLDMSGVKDRSKIVLLEDPISQEKRYLEMRRNAKMERASKSISEISLEVDKLAGQVSALESMISKGGKVAETDVFSLIELLMNQLLKLDGIIADGDVKLQRKMQVFEIFFHGFAESSFPITHCSFVYVLESEGLISHSMFFEKFILKVRRVQKYVETLDMLKIKNSLHSSNGDQTPMQHQQKYSNGQRPPPIQQQQPRRSAGNLAAQMQQMQLHPPELASGRSTSGAVVVTTQWETFDSTPALLPVSSPSTSTSASINQAAPKFNWEFFD